MDVKHLNNIEAAFGKVSITPPINGVYPDFFFGIPSGVLDDVYARIGIIPGFRHYCARPCSRHIGIRCRGDCGT